MDLAAFERIFLSKGLRVERAAIVGNSRCDIHDAGRDDRERGPRREIAELLERRHIKRVPVVSDGRLAGVVSRANPLHGLANR